MATGSITREELSGRRKSAILCMSLGSEAAAKVMQKLSGDEVEALSLEIAMLPVVGADVTSGVIREFHDVTRAVKSLAQGGVSVARDILQHAVGDRRASSILTRIQEQMVDTGLRRLRKAPPELLHTVLRGEHPQTVALILAHLSRRQAAAVIESLDQETATNVLYRMARMEKVAPDMLQMVETGLASKADLSLSQEMTASGGPESVAQVLNLLSASVEKELLGTIGDRNAELAEEIKGLMFVFEDLCKVDDRSMQRVLRELDSKELALALKAASDELTQHIMKNMSERAASALQDEGEYLGPVRVKDVEAAQGRILAQVRALEEAEEVVLSSGSDDNAVIE